MKPCQIRRKLACLLVVGALVAATGTPRALAFALAVSEEFDLNGHNFYSDSYDSGDPNYSNNGWYPVGDPSKRKANGDVCVGQRMTSPSTAANAKIVGSLHTGPDTNSLWIGPMGSVGDMAWVMSGKTNIQPGHLAMDFNGEFPDVSLVAESPTWITLNPNPETINGVTYQYVISTAGNYQINALTGSLLVNAPSDATVRVYLPNNVYLYGTQAIRLADTGAWLRVIVGGAGFWLGGAATLDNVSGIPARLCLLGLPTCTNVYLSANTYYAGIYAPRAHCYLGGGGSATYDFCGVAMSRSLSLGNHYNFHFDEDLNRQGLFPPRISYQPTNQTALVGSNVTIRVVPEWPKAFQWRRGGVDIPDATNAALSLTNVTLADAGGYSVVVANDYGSVTSSVATLTVVENPAARLSIRPGTGGAVEVNVSEPPGLLYLVYASTNLSNWDAVMYGFSPFTFRDTNALTTPRRFYRAQWFYW